MDDKIIDVLSTGIEYLPGDDELSVKKDKIQVVETDIISEVDSLGENKVPTTSVEPSIAESSYAEVMNIVKRQVSILLDTTDVPVDVPLMDMDLQSFGSAELAAHLSIAFNLKLMPAILYEYPTIEGIVTFITEELLQLQEEEGSTLYDALNDKAGVEEEARDHRGEWEESQSSPSLSTPQKSAYDTTGTPSGKTDSIEFSRENVKCSLFVSPSKAVRTPSRKSSKTSSGKFDSGRLTNMNVQRSPCFELLREECVFIGDNSMGIDSMSGLTLYKKTQDFNDLEFINMVDSAFATILDLNPILTGCIVKKAHSVTGQNGFFVEPKRFQSKDLFKVVHMEIDKSFEIPSDKREMAMFISSTCEHMIARLGTGFSQLKNKSPLITLKVITLPDDKHIVLQFSLSHAIADAHTVSKIISQLNQSLQDKVITPLRWDIPRKSIVDNRIYSWFEKIVLFVWLLLFKILDNLFLSLWSLSSLRAGVNFVLVNNAAIEKIRRQIGSSSSKYISDNDIILSAMSRKINKSVITYLLNTRCYVDGITADFAHDWSVVLAIPRSICANPSNVRNLSSINDASQRPDLFDFTNFFLPGITLNSNITEYDMAMHMHPHVEWICFIPTLDGYRRQPCFRATMTFKLNSDTTMIFCGCHKTYQELLVKSRDNNGDPYDEIFMLSTSDNSNITPSLCK